MFVALNVVLLIKILKTSLKILIFGRGSIRHIVTSLKIFIYNFKQFLSFLNNYLILHNFFNGSSCQIILNFGVPSSYLSNFP
jgi:hypothetical protein